METFNITDNQINASSNFVPYRAAFARLNTIFYYFIGTCLVGWAAFINSNTSTWLEIDFQNKLTVVTGVATQGGKLWGRGTFVTKYKLQYGNDTGSLFVYMESDTNKEKVSELKVFLSTQE